jgi:DNA-binding NtrC family response regulator
MSLLNLTKEEFEQLKALLYEVEDRKLLDELLIETIYHKYAGNKIRAARALGVCFRTLTNWCRAHGYRRTDLTTRMVSNVDDKSRDKQEDYEAKSS